MRSSVEAVVAAVSDWTTAPVAVALPDYHDRTATFVVVDVMHGPVEVASIRPVTVVATVYAPSNGSAASTAGGLWDAIADAGNSADLVGITPVHPPHIARDPDDPKQARWELSFTAAHISI